MPLLGGVGAPQGAVGSLGPIQNLGRPRRVPYPPVLSEHLCVPPVPLPPDREDGGVRPPRVNCFVALHTRSGMREQLMEWINTLAV